MELQAPNSDTTTSAQKLPPDSNNVDHFTSTHDVDIDSTCSTPYVSAPSSPGRCGGGGGGFFYSAPASPMHFSMLSISKQSSTDSSLSKSGSFEFDFSARFGSFGSGSTGSMSSADELFLNGQIRPMKLSSHLERPQVLAPLLDLEVEDDDEFGSDGSGRGRDSRLRDRSVHRRARSLSPLRNAPFLWIEDELDGDRASCSAHEDSTKNINGNGEECNQAEEATDAPSASASASRSSSAGRSSKRWVFLKDFLRSKSEGRSNNKFWSTISFSPAGKEKKPTNPTPPPPEPSQKAKNPGKKPANGLRKRRVPLSAHELHYTANRAQAEELRKKTYLPYRQGLLGCLGFSSKGYGAMNGFARALNPVSSR